MNNRLTMIMRFLIHFCDMTQLCRVRGMDSERKARQILEIRSKVNQYFINYLGCESIHHMQIVDLEIFGINTPLVFGLLDELGQYMTKKSEIKVADFLARQAQYQFIGSSQTKAEVVMQFSTSLFFALHFIMQKLCPERTDKKFKVSVAEQIIDDLLIDQFQKRGLIISKRVVPQVAEEAPLSQNQLEQKIFVSEKAVVSNIKVDQKEPPIDSSTVLRSRVFSKRLAQVRFLKNRLSMGAR